MSHIFISYSRTDEAFARQLAEALSNAGAEVWLDVEDISAGINWSSAIQQGLDSCDLMIVIISPASAASRNVEEEWQYYRDKGKPIVPVLWRRANVHYQLSRLQYVDFERQSFATAFKQLHGELRRNGLRLNPLPGVSDTSTTIPMQPQLPEKSSRRVSTLVWGVALVVMIGVGLVGLFALNGGFGGGGETPTSSATATEQAVGQPPTDAPFLLPTEAPAPSITPVPPTSTSSPTSTETLSKTEESVTISALIQLIQTEDAATLALAAELTAAASATEAQATIDAQATGNWLATFIALGTANALTATATWWTLTPTPDYRLTAEAQLEVQRMATQLSLDATATATLWTQTPAPGYADGAPITVNAQWIPHIRAFDGVAMAFVPVGCFTIGSELRSSDEVHGNRLCFNEPFWIDVYEVTNGQYKQQTGQMPPSHWQDNERPLEGISWFDARDYCALRGGRLPTEAEWEYIARGPDNLVYPWGNTFEAERVVYGGNSENHTAVVGSRPGGVSWVGALDISGNVWEWVSSLYEAYPYDTNDGREHDTGLSSDVQRVLRGGSWLVLNTSFLRNSNRDGGNPFDMSDYFGVRCARDYQRWDMNAG